MPVNIKLIRSKEFIKTTVTGVLDLAVSKQTLVDIASAIEQPGEYEILVDTRNAEAALSVVDNFELGMALAAYSALLPSKIALLTSRRDMKDAEFFETTTVNRGFRIKMFIDFEEAITWLVMQESP